MARNVTLSRDEAEMLVDLCEHSPDGRLWDLAAFLREQWGMKAQTLDENGRPIPDVPLERCVRKT